jgi:DNA-binding NarL/FixJ family response regulator
VAPPALDARASLRACLQSLGMTPRQLDVLELLLQGKPNKLIARELRLSVETVKDHVRAVLRTLNVTTRTQAVLAVSRLLAGPGSPAPWTRPLAP